MPAKTTKDAHIALLLPLAVSQGWTVKRFAQTAQIDTGEACRLLKSGTEQAIAALGELESVDALSLTVKLGNENVTLGKIQGKMVSGAVRSLGRLPGDPDQWDESNDKTYRRCQTVLRDAKALGLIRFSEGDKGGNPPQLRHVDPFAAQNTPGKQGKSEKPLEESSTVNDGASPLDGDGADNPPVQEEGVE